MRKNIIIVSTIVLTITIITFVVILFERKSDSFVQTTVFEKNYNLVSLCEEEDYFSVDMYLSCKDSYIVQKNNISSCSIKGDNIDSILLKLNSIVDMDTYIEIKNKKFYLYKFEFMINLKASIETSIVMEDAFLEIVYLNNKSVSINVGSLNIYKIPFFGDSNKIISVNNIKGIVNKINEEKMLVGVALTISNSNSQAQITDIIPLDNNIECSYNDIKIYNDIVNYSSDISSLIGMNYDPYSSNSNSSLSINGNNQYIIPLKYKKESNSNRFGFIIKYRINDMEYNYYFDDFLFYTNHYFSSNEINKLVFYKYENN